MSTTLDFTLAPMLRNGSSTVTDWDNDSNQLVHASDYAHSSAEECEHWCAADTACLQWSWSWSDEQCRTLDHVKQGHRVEDDVISGWDLAKLGRLGFKVEAD